jgi:hypothetical protein
MAHITHLQEEVAGYVGLTVFNIHDAIWEWMWNRRYRSMDIRSFYTKRTHMPTTTHHGIFERPPVNSGL